MYKPSKPKVTALCISPVDLILGACSTESMADRVFDDHSKFAYEGSDGEAVVYYCEKGASEADAQKRSQQVHLYFDRELNDLAERSADDFVEERITIEQWENRIEVEAKKNRRT